MIVILNKKNLTRGGKTAPTVFSKRRPLMQAMKTPNPYATLT